MARLKDILQFMKLYSYTVKYDTGLAPNPFWGKLTLNLCKPAIRRTAVETNWIIGTGSKNVKSKSGRTLDYSGKLVYAMKVTSKLTMEEYDVFCNDELKKKVPFPDTKDLRRVLGDSIYDYSVNKIPRLRKMKNLHDESNRETDLSGQNTLISEHFYYFGKNAVDISEKFPSLIKNSIGHLICEDNEIIEEFEKWISQYEVNKEYGEPQLFWRIEDGAFESCKIKCDK
jgi:Nucleotide modification associated domain 2